MPVVEYVSRNEKNICNGCCRLERRLRLPVRIFAKSLISQMEGEIERLVRENCSDDKPILRIEISGKLKAGYKNLQIETQEIVRRFSDNAIVEIGRDGVEVAGGSQSQGGDGIALSDGASIKDYGLGVFAERLRENGYSLDRNPGELFDILSSEGSKEKAVKHAMGLLLGQ